MAQRFPHLFFFGFCMLLCRISKSLDLRSDTVIPWYRGLPAEVLMDVFPELFEEFGGTTCKYEEASRLRIFRIQMMVLYWVHQDPAIWDGWTLGEKLVIFHDDTWYHTMLMIPISGGAKTRPQVVFSFKLKGLAETYKIQYILDPYYVRLVKG